MQIRKTKRKKNYYICENNPKSCNYISWNKPKPGEKYDDNEDMSEIEKETNTKTKAKKSTTKRKTTKKVTKKK